MNKLLTILTLITLFSINQIYARGHHSQAKKGAKYLGSRETDGEKQAWQIGDPYHKLHFEVPTELGTKELLLNEFEKTDETYSGNICSSTKYMKYDFISNTRQFMNYTTYAFRIVDDTFVLYREDKRSRCFTLVDTVSSDDLIEQLANETKMMVERILFYIDKKINHINSIADASYNYNQWASDAKELIRFAFTVHEDLGEATQDNLWSNAPAVDIALKITEFFSENHIIRQIVKPIEQHEQDNIPLLRKPLHRNYYYNNEFITMVMRNNFELDQILELRKQIGRFSRKNPEKYPERVKLQYQLDQLYSTYDYNKDVLRRLCPNQNWGECNDI